MSLLPRALLPLAAITALLGCKTAAETPRPYLDLRERGLSQMRSQNYLAASATFKDAVTRYPGESMNQDLMLLQSDCELQLGHEAEARGIRERVAREAIAADVRMRAHLGLAMMDFRKERYDSAAEKFQTAAGLEPEPADRAMLLYQTGLSLQRGGKFAEARASYKKAIELASDSESSGRARMQLLYPDHFLVQTGAFSRPANAQSQRDLLARKGFPAEVAVLDAPRGKLHCVWVGNLRRRSEATELLDRIVASKALPETARIAVKP